MLNELDVGNLDWKCAKSIIYRVTKGIPSHIGCRKLRNSPI